MKHSPDNTQGFQLKLDLHSGVPVYRQIIDQVRGGMSAGMLAAGDQLPTVRQLAVDLAINPNTVLRAYRELELGGMLETHQGTGTFISEKKNQPEQCRARTATGATGGRVRRPRRRRRIHRGRFAGTFTRDGARSWAESE